MLPSLALSLFSLASLPSALAGVHKFPLHKLTPAAHNTNPGLEVMYLSEKYGAANVGGQVPLLGSGGAGRRLGFAKPSHDENGEQLLWTQEEFGKGGHGVPLTSTFSAG